MLVDLKDWLGGRRNLFFRRVLTNYERCCLGYDYFWTI